MKVKVYIINKNQTGQYYGLKNEENQILPFTPTWKTLRGAKNWAKKNGLEIVE